MSRFTTPAHLASWAKFSPGVKESAGRKKGTGLPDTEPLPRQDLREAAIGARRTDTFLGESYRRIARRRGKKKALVAVGRSILVIVWHLLSPTPRPATTTSDPTTRPPTDPPAPAPANTSDNSNALGYKVALEPAA